MSEERESIENVYDFIFDGDCYNVVYVYKTYWDEIQKKLKALNIINEKGINLYKLRMCNNVEEYNKLCNSALPLTPKEFDLLKEILK